MASVMGINKIGLPKLSENMDPEDARALRSYLYQMQEQLQYVLSNLDVENMSDEMRTKAAEFIRKGEYMANRKKKDEALAAVQAQTEGSGQPAVQSGYSARRD